MPSPVSIAHGRVEHLPRIHQFDIGQYEERADGADANRIIVLERRQTRPSDLIFGLIENLSQDSGVSFIFSVEESSDNGVSDTYAGFNIRVGAASVANITVVPGGAVEFLIEGTTEVFIKLVADSQDDSRGRVTLAHFSGKLVRRERIAVP